MKKDSSYMPAAYNDWFNRHESRTADGKLIRCLTAEAAAEIFNLPPETVRAEFDWLRADEDNTRCLLLQVMATRAQYDAKMETARDFYMEDDAARCDGHGEIRRVRRTPDAHYDVKTGREVSYVYFPGYISSRDIVGKNDISRW